MRSIQTYYSILRKKGLYTCLREAKKALWPVWFTRSKAAINLIQSERTSRYLWRKYKDLITMPLEADGQVIQPTRVVWVCWLQGVEQAPDIVKKCIASIRSQMPDYELRVLTADNIFKYASLPEHIVRKYQNGTINFTHFSDILRTALLVQHGGIWMDATVLLTTPIPDYMRDEPLFFPQKSVLQSDPHSGSSWFIVAKKGNPVLKRVLDLLCAYWKSHHVLCDYFLLHLFVHLVMTKNEQGKSILQAMPYIPNADAHTMQYRLFRQYDEKAWNLMLSRSAIHKLTWKFNNNEPLDKKGTNYDYILHHMHL